MKVSSSLQLYFPILPNLEHFSICGDGDGQFISVLLKVKIVDRQALSTRYIPWAHTHSPLRMVDNLDALQ